MTACELNESDEIVEDLKELGNDDLVESNAQVKMIPPSMSSDHESIQGNATIDLSFFSHFQRDCLTLSEDEFTKLVDEIEADLPKFFLENIRRGVRIIL